MQMPDKEKFLYRISIQIGLQIMQSFRPFV